MSSEDDFKYQWPAIQCVHSASADTWSSAVSGRVFVTEKLDGSCLALCSQGIVASRRKVLATVNHDQYDSLEKVKFSGSKLIILKQHLSCDLFNLKGKLADTLSHSEFEVIVYGEWINKGTATSANDEYGYAERAILPGTFHAFGVGLVSSADFHNNTLGFRKADGGGYWWAPLSPDLAKLLTSCGFKTVPILGAWSLMDVFPANLPLLQPPCKAEGLVLSRLEGGALLKWKNALANTDVRHDEANLGRIQSALPSSTKTEEVISCLRVTSTKTNEELMEKMFASAASKYPSLGDVLHNSPGKDSVVNEWFASIEREMTADLQSSSANAEGIRSFMHKKKTICLSRHVPNM